MERFWYPVFISIYINGIWNEADPTPQKCGWGELTGMSYITGNLRYQTPLGESLKAIEGGQGGSIPLEWVEKMRCKECGKNFSKPWNIQDHVRRVHTPKDKTERPLLSM